MREPEPLPYADSPTHASDPQAQLLAAAQALRTWVLEQREGWLTEEAPAAKPAARRGKAPKASRAAAAEPVAPPASSWRASLSVLAGLEAPSAAGRTETAARVAPPVAPPAPPVVPPVALRPEVLQPVVLEPLAASTGAESPAPVSWRPSIEIAEEPAGDGWLASLRESAGPYVLRGFLALGVVGLVGLAGWTGRNYLTRRAETPPPPGRAVLESVPSGLDVTIDGKPSGKTPMTTELAPGRHLVEFTRRGVTRRLEMTIVSGEATTERLDWAAKRKGSLEVLSDPEGATVTIDGKARGTTPLTIDDLPVGMHTVVLETASGSLQRTVVIAEDKVAQVTEAIYSGWLHVSAPVEVQISEKGRRLQLDDRNQILLPPGAHEFQIESAALGYKTTRRVDVKPGAITSVAVDPDPGSLSVNASLPAEVLVDGQRVGETPLTDQKIDLGTRLVTVRSITGAERRFTLTVTAHKPVQLDVDFSKP